mmetsp:Transcript_27236/g.67174  ORF Transcript_27236/g.67174 Transcript_27236/m.67174 type:complete len:446 (-) Transcript_27236:4360-5697(-)
MCTSPSPRCSPACRPRARRRSRTRSSPRASRGPSRGRRRCRAPRPRTGSVLTRGQGPSSTCTRTWPSPRCWSASGCGPARARPRRRRGPSRPGAWRRGASRCCWLRGVQASWRARPRRATPPARTAWRGPRRETPPRSAPPPPPSRRARAPRRAREREGLVVDLGGEEGDEELGLAAVGLQLHLARHRRARRGRRDGHRLEHEVRRRRRHHAPHRRQRVPDLDLERGREPRWPLGGQPVGPDGDGREVAHGDGQRAATELRDGHGEDRRSEVYGRLRGLAASAHPRDEARRVGGAQRAPRKARHRGVGPVVTERDARRGRHRRRLRAALERLRRRPPEGGQRHALERYGHGDGPAGRCGRHRYREVDLGVDVQEGFDGGGDAADGDGEVVDARDAREVVQPDADGLAVARIEQARGAVAHATVERGRARLDVGDAGRREVLPGKR